VNTARVQHGSSSKIQITVFTVLGAVANGDGVTETEQKRTDCEFEAADRIPQNLVP